MITEEKLFNYLNSGTLSKKDQKVITQLIVNQMFIFGCTCSNAFKEENEKALQFLCSNALVIDKIKSEGAQIIFSASQ